jgi:hypothetical protein
MQVKGLECVTFDAYQQRCARDNRSECTCFPVSLQSHIKIAIFSQWPAKH